jgi:hypothetical protein
MNPARDEPGTVTGTPCARRNDVGVPLILPIAAFAIHYPRHEWLPEDI